jgi:uncharacterized membrane protein YbhN (UPF0104 family)
VKGYTKKIVGIVLGLILLSILIFFFGVSAEEIVKRLLKIQLYEISILLFLTFISLFTIAMRWKLLVGCFMDIKNFDKGFFFII